ncbi:dynamin family protein [Helicobacter sp. MIT 21-1697]|uniref:dynamin family protein n=1 Tax=Helicobacter sp. MIT 21-1697 TaxID=2993733 RepID=UPI00224A4CB4|nr:dynamin family protein [Helicobacter sp. MIT 21-1697]MCX2717699.1 dynamin family protein [Helicobacter sp. MIT 21-1697]
MPILQHFFETFHRVQPPLPMEKIQDSMFNTLCPQTLSILLCANERNLALFMQCQSFIKILESLHISRIQSQIDSYTTNDDKTMVLSALLQDILTLQATLIEHNPHLFEELLPFFIRLNLAHIIDEHELDLFASLKNTFLTKKKTQKDTPKPQQSLKSLHNALSLIHTNLSPLLPQESLKNSLAHIIEKLENQHFSIGITGVLSAGKSTFLNALLSQEILGSSSVPETANLTILRYGEMAGARVHFWSKKQWADLCEQSAYDKSLKDFIEESQAHFGAQLDTFITQPHTTKEIQINELSIYTSANHTSKFCNLIQEVELFTPLSFLKNGVEIVDTPGLDDPITKREEITRAYIQRCDVLIHVMNASCAATQVDIDFILESLLEQNISRLLVVLTRIDLLTPQELKSSLEYTKSSLVAQLKKANYKGDMQSLMNRIDFIPLAGYAALLYRTKGDTSNLSLTLEQSGILEIESYLQKMLLGEDSLKAKDMLYLAYKATLKVAQDAEEIINLESSLLNASGEELEELIAQDKAHNEALMRELHELETHLNALHNELSEFLDSLQLFSANTLNKASTLIKDKVFNDIVYDYTRGAKPDTNALHKMIELGLKDCFADVGREYKYKLGKKIAQLKSAITLTDEVDSPPPHIHFQLKNAQINAITQELLSALPSLVRSFNTSSQNKLSNALDKLFADMFRSFGEIIQNKNKDITALFLAHFNEITQSMKNHIQMQIAYKQESLNAALAKRENGNTQALKESLSAQQKNLKNIIDELLQGLHNLQ